MRQFPDAYYQPLPTAVTDDPLGYAWSLFGLMIVTFVFLQWTYSSTWRMVRYPEVYNHPRTVWRLFLLLTGISGVLRNGPDVLLWGLWTVCSPETRHWLSHWNRVLDGVSGPFQVAAAALLGWGVSVIEFQLGKQPIPVHLYPTWERMARPLSLLVGTMGLCLAIAFLR